MSTIYISEPPANGKIILNTSEGELNIELWSKEAPLACKNFIQLCMEGYYNNTKFHRLVKKFVIQGGDPTGTGDGGKSVYGKPFKLELHSRLRFNRRGLVAMHCVDGQVHGSQFFFTLAETQELQGNYTIFGSIVDKTVFNLINLAEGLLDKETGLPLNPKRILSTEVILNPFSDIVPRSLKDDLVTEPDELPQLEEDNTNREPGPLSFADELEEDDENVTPLKTKSKSAHDYAKHANLSKDVLVIDPNEELCVVGKLAMNIFLEPDKIEDKKPNEKLENMRKQSNIMENELVKNMRRKQAGDEDELASEIRESKLPMLQTQEEVKLQRGGGGPSSLLSNREKMERTGQLLSMLQKGKAGQDWWCGQMIAEKPSNTDSAELAVDSLGIVIEKKTELDVVRVQDPDVYNPERYALNDPRNPLNVRKRQSELEPDIDKKKKKHK